MVEKVMMVNFPLFPFPFVSFPCSSYSEVLPATKKLNKHIVDMHKEPTSCIICFKTFLNKLKKNSGTVLSIFPHHTPSRPVEKSLGEEAASLGTRSSATLHPPYSHSQCNHCGKNFSRKSSPHGGGPWS